MSEPPQQHEGHLKGSTAALAITALGVVFGDIGTSPLYALRECFKGDHGTTVSVPNVLGVLSLIVWSLILVVSIKYQAYVLRADHGGEGGILALTALAVPQRARTAQKPGIARRMLLLVGLFGAALLYGDGVIAPSISVLSAAEGLEVIAPSLHRFVIPMTCVILVGIFWVQKRGTRGVGSVFGPVMGLWFLVLGCLGIYQILQEPRVLQAFNPYHAVDFFLREKLDGFVVLGAVFLVATGSENMYADLGHFGKTPIRITWFFLAFPALLLNYFGQGALALRDPGAVENLFFRTAPSWAIVPIVILSTFATIIASQAVISGAFSLSRQAIMMGYLPRMKIEHTSANQVGQIYVPAINWILMIGCLAMVLGFRSSSSLAAAYGIAVTSTMAITTILAFRVARARWKWPLVFAGAVTIVFLVADISFLGANLFKLADGGWVPLAIAMAMIILMTTWKTGRRLLAERTEQRTIKLSKFMEEVRHDDGKLFLARVPGTAVYMSSTPDVVPLALTYTTKHHHVLHERVVILTIRTDDMPHVDQAERAWVEPLGKGFWRVTGVYGFMQDPNVPELLKYVATLQPELDIDVHDATFFLGQETILASDHPGMAKWREHLFAALARNAQKATRFFGLPADRVVEVGAYIEL